MNYMKEVAQMLGVEIGEEFKVKYSDDVISSSTYRFTEYSLNEIEGDKVRPYCYGILTALLNGTDSVVKLPKPILDDEEKKYLSGVIEPFRNDIKCIRKDEHPIYNEYEFISYFINTCELQSSCYLPPFKKGIMYKGMEVGEEYTLEELDI